VVVAGSKDSAMGRHMTDAEISAVQQLRLKFQGKKREGQNFVLRAQNLVKRMRRNDKPKQRTPPSKASIMRAVKKRLGEKESRGRGKALTKRQEETLVRVAGQMARSTKPGEKTADMIQRKAFRGKKKSATALCEMCWQGVA